MIRLLGTIVTASALLLGTAPALAARPVVKDGFTATGPAGSQVRIRVERSMPAESDDAFPGLQMTASRGAIAGFALLSTREHRERLAFAIRTLPKWACWNEACAENALQDTRTWTSMPKQDYILMLIGEPGATVTVTLPPARRNGSTTRIRATRGATPVIAPTSMTSAGRDDTGLVAFGEFAAPAWTTPHAVVGVVHTTAVHGGGNVNSDISIGARRGDSCVGISRGRSTGPFHPPAGKHVTHALLSLCAPSAGLCGTWQASTLSPLSRHRALGIFVPIVL